MHSIIKNHAFVDGNKRTAVMSVVVFYGLNGHVFDADEIELVHLAVDIAIGRHDVPGIEKFLEQWAHPLPDLDADEEPPWGTI
jgi:death-on-curing protein